MTAQQDGSGRSSREIARRLATLTVPSRRQGLAALALAVSAVALAVTGPLLVGRAIDTIFGGVIGASMDQGSTLDEVVAQLRASGQSEYADLVSRLDVIPGAGIDFGLLGLLVLSIVAVYGASALTEYLYGRILNDAAHDAARTLRTMVEDKVHRLPASRLMGAARGDLLSRATNDVDNVTRTLSQTLSQLVVAILTAVGVLAMMLWVSPLLTLVAILIIPAIFALTRWVMKRSQPLFVAQWTQTGELNGQIEEAFTGHEVVRQFGQREAVLARFEVTNDELARTGHRAQFLSGLINPGTVLLSNLAFVVICVVGAIRVLHGHMTLGGVTAFVQYSQQLAAPLSQISSMSNTVQSGLASAERVFELLDLPEEEVRARVDLPGERQGAVTFEDVTFDYGDGALIENLNLSVAPGSTVAIVGRTGSGKTTLANLLLGFHDLKGGCILVDGVDIATVSRSQAREWCGVVLQESWLFRGSIWDNIAYGLPGATDAQVRRAAELANVDSFAQLLPDSYDTIIEDDGANLSSGERQLITVARALLKDPPILVLDEATSAVDTRTEMHVQDALSTLRGGRTAIVIAHRLSTIRNADQVVVMEQGRIVERGTHDELLERRGTYFDLHQEQLRVAARPAPIPA